jgi:subtilase family serine protease
VKRILLLLIVLVVAGTFGTAESGAADRVIDDSDIVTLPGNVHPLARPEFDTGLAPSSLPLEQMILVLKRGADKQAELDQFLAGLQDPTSSDFHRWLAPDEFGNRFGPSPEDINAVTGWLTSHGFVVEAIGKGKSWINFSGTAGQVKATFHTTIHVYQVKGRLYHANAEDPSIPRGLADVVAGVASLNDFPRKPMHSGVRPAAQPDYTSGSSHSLSPGDFAIIYDVNALYSAGINGSGQSIAIVGRTLPATASTDWAAFRTLMGLSANAPQVIVTTRKSPGDLGTDEDAEADLDVEWSGAVAPNATIYFVTSKSTDTTDGVDLSAQYIVDNKTAPVMSTSFGECEADLGATENQFYSNLWSQAAGEGITAFVSSGDSGAAGCDADSETTATLGLAVNGLASTPYNVAAGGTEFNEGSGTYWSGTNNGYTSALSYIPEVVWNESGANGGSDLYATGGGLSIEYTKPSWQVAPGVPSTNSRCVPDVALSSAGHDAYLVELQGTLYEVYGTSAASPSMAGLMALIVQKTGQSQGNANTRLYQLGNAQYATGGVVVFHDITSGNNSVPGLTGYSAGTGYSCTAGLGSMDAYALAMNWTPDFAIAASPNAFSIDQGSAGTSTIQTNVLGNFDSAVALSASGLPTGVTAGFSPATIAAPGSGSSTMTITVGASSPPGSYPITVTGSGNGAAHTATITLTIIQTYTVTSSVSAGSGAITPASARIPSGSPAVFTIYPGTGYYLATLTDNGANVTSSVVGGTYTIASVLASHTVVATFAIDTYTITAVGSGNGSITDSSGSVSYGGSVTFTITPASGYGLSGLTDNGVAVSPTQGPSGTFTYTITDVTANHTVDATFALVTAGPVPAMGSWSFIGAACAMLWLAMKRRRKA